MGNKEISISRLPSAYIITAIVIATILFSFIQQDYSVPADGEIKETARNIQSMPEGSKVLILVNYGPDGRYELETGLSSLITVLAKKDIGILFASLIPQGIESTSLAVEKSISKIDFRKQGYFYGKNYVQLGYLAGGSIAAAMMQGDIESFRSRDIFGNNLRDLPVMNGVFDINDISGIIEFSSGKVDGVPGAVFYTVFNRNREIPVIAVCSSDLVADYLPFKDSGSISSLVQGMKGIVSLESVLTERSESKKRFFTSTGVLWLVLLIILIGNLSRLLRGKK